jgi:hypothetical protein
MGPWFRESKALETLSRWLILSIEYGTNQCIPPIAIPTLARAREFKCQETRPPAIRTGYIQWRSLVEEQQPLRSKFLELLFCAGACRALFALLQSRTF